MTVSEIVNGLNLVSLKTEAVRHTQVRRHQCTPDTVRTMIVPPTIEVR